MARTTRSGLLAGVALAATLASASGGCPIRHLDDQQQVADCANLLKPAGAIRAPQPDEPPDAPPSQALLELYVRALSEDIGPRSYRSPDALIATARYVAEQFGRLDAAAVCADDYRIPEPWLDELKSKSMRKCKERWPDFEGLIRTTTFRNVALRIEGSSKPDEVIVVGAHYDSDACESHGCNPGADDNASGVAALLVLAKRLRDDPPARSVELVAFTNEEEPFFQTCAMGSVVYASRQAASEDAAVGRRRVVAAVSLETLGYYADAEDTQRYSSFTALLHALDYPDTGNFLAIVGDHASEPLVAALLQELRWGAPASRRPIVPLPVEGLVGWRSQLLRLGWSDHWSYWQLGLPGVMITDTAPLRNDCYHRLCDTADRLDFRRLAVAVDEVERALRAVAASEAAIFKTDGRTSFARECLEHLDRAVPRPAAGRTPALPSCHRSPDSIGTP